MAVSTAPAYEVTATKRRPQTFDELIGQEFVVSTLQNSLRSGSIAHAYLFSGPRGCGKTSAARILARSLNCEQEPAAGAGGPCGTCDNCKSIRAGSNMDVIEIDGASNTSVNDVRQIKDEVLFPPQTGRYKIYIIDEVHMLSNNAFNALLKTIEEPPPYIIFIFATTELHKVPATIKSRCQQFSFRLIPIETIQDILKKICGEMGIEAEDRALFWIARESTGSMRDAFTLFDQVVSFSRGDTSGPGAGSGGHIREELIREKLGLAGLEKINTLAGTCAANDTAAALALTDTVLAAGVAIEQFIIDLAGYYRSILLLKNGITRESLLGYRAEEFSAQVIEAYDSARLNQALEILLECYRNIRYSVSPRFELESAVAKLSWLSQWVSPLELKSALDGARHTLRSQAGPANTGGGGSRPSAQTDTRPPQPRRKEGSQSLAEEYRRMLAAKANPDAAPESTDDDEEPAWSGIIHNSGAGNPAAHAPSGDIPSAYTMPPGDNISEGGISPIDRVLKIIPGTAEQ